MPGLDIKEWTLSTHGVCDSFSESIFFLGNGHIGVRGFSSFEEKIRPEEHAIFRAGLFEYIKPGITDMVQLPDLLTLKLEGGEAGEILQTLDMRRGIQIQYYECPRFTVLQERMASMADKQLLCVRMTVTAKEACGAAILSVENALVSNLPVNDDQTILETETARLLFLDEMNGGRACFHTEPSGHRVSFLWELLPSIPCDTILTVHGDRVTERFPFSLAAGDTFILEKRIRILRDDEPAGINSADPWADHSAALIELWEDCDIELDADERLQGAVRYNIFQMLCSNASDDPNVSIGARGLTHGRYKGNTFWDTEIFLFPFYLWTRPEAAKNLLLYRTDRLGDAKKLAKKMNLDGARYPWMCSDTGNEQCESWDIGACEVHVTADVCYAMRHYVMVTDDEKFQSERAAEIYRETARCFVSRLTPEAEKDRYSLFFVKGPDEYCGAAVNNTYTNFMVRYNLRLAIKHGELDSAEKRKFEEIEKKIPLLYDPRRDLFLQDELFERLEEAPFVKAGQVPMYRQVCFDRLQRYRVLKQADLVLLMNLFPGEFTENQKRNVFCYYEPLTLHDSTLSYGPHAQLALRLCEMDKGKDYLRKAVFLDIDDIMGNTGHEGIHMAALGAAWQALIFGAAGLSLGENGTVTVQPHLPDNIHAMRFHVKARQKRYRIHVTDTGITEVQQIS